MRLRRLRQIGFGFFLLAALVFYLANLLSPLNFLVQDALCRRPGRPQADIFVIGVDDKTLNALGPWNAWPRSTMAELLRVLNADPACRPAAIGLDVMYFGATDPEADAALVSAVRDADNVVLASQLVYPDGAWQAGGASGGSGLQPQGVQLPMPPLDALARSGFTNVFLDRDGAVRRGLHSVELDGRTYPNFAYAVYTLYAEHNGLIPRPPACDKSGMWNIGYSAEPGGYGQGLSFLDVLEGRVPAALFQDAVVIVGAYASGMQDSYYTPLSKAEPMYGAEINANMVQALCQGRAPRSAPVWMQAAVLLAGLLLCGRAYRSGRGPRLSALALATLGFLCAAVLLNQIGWIVDPLYLPLFSVLLYGWRTASGFLEEQRRRMLTLETFQRYVSPEVARHLLESGANGLVRSSEKRQIAVLFVDIRGFTPLSESLEPEQVAGILNEYLTLTSTAVFHNGGTVDKFIGDATMALFNAPGDLDDYVFRAVRTALEIAEGGGALQEKVTALCGKTVRFGIGVHCGEAVTGSIGAPFRMDYTAIGDTVNTAARLESAAGPGQILVSPAVCAALEGRIDVSFVENRLLKGKAAPMALYQVNGCRDASAAPAAPACVPAP